MLLFTRIYLESSKDIFAPTSKSCLGDDTSPVWVIEKNYHIQK